MRKRLSRLGAVVAVILGLTMVLSACGSIYDLPLPGGANVGSNPLTIHIMFRDVMDLVPQSTVKVNDVSVGKVTAISLHGQVADVTVQIPRATKLPANAIATIRQTSLLGEKFVSLSAPVNPEGTLASGDTIGLPNTGTNPEVEDVLKALGALLSGGGVGQLKLISQELNAAIGGKEAQVRSVLSQLHFFMGQLAASKSQIVTAVDNLNKLAVSLKAQDPTIVATLDDIPGALASVNNQRADLVKMLGALNKLSGIGVQVIEASKTATINSLTDLSPVLSELAATGDNLPKAFQIFLTYPFVDSVVGTTPTVANRTEFGDYTNLSVNVDLDLLNLNIPQLPPTTLQGLLQVCNGTALKPLCSSLGTVLGSSGSTCSTLAKTLGLCTGTSAKVTSGTTTGKSTGSSGSNPLSGLLGSLTGGLLPRAAYGSSSGAVHRTPNDGMSYLLLQGAMQ